MSTWRARRLWRDRRRRQRLCCPQSRSTIVWSSFAFTPRLMHSKTSAVHSKTLSAKGVRIGGLSYGPLSRTCTLEEVAGAASALAFLWLRAGAVAALARVHTGEKVAAVACAHVHTGEQIARPPTQSKLGLPDRIITRTCVMPRRQQMHMPQRQQMLSKGASKC